MLYFLFSFEKGYNLNHRGVLSEVWLGENAALLPIFLALLAIAAFAAYLIGSVNTAVIVSKKMYSDDVRDHGSGNAGFTNMMRLYGKKAAFITFAGDFFKAVAATLIGWVLYGYMGAIVAGLFVFIGHVLPIFHKFRGGKGIVCAAGVLFTLDIFLFALLIAIFIVTVLVTKYISFGSVLSALVMPLFINKLGGLERQIFRIVYTINSERVKSFAVVASTIVTIIVIIKHWQNLKRIFNGTESKFEFKKSRKDSSDGE